jgi:hypothetical protein
MAQSAKQILRQQIRAILKGMSNEDRIAQSKIVTNNMNYTRFLI